MKNIAIVFAAILLGLACTVNARGQGDSGTWPLTSVTTVTATTSGDVTAQSESFGSMVINNYSGPGSSQRVTTTDGSWPAETQQNDSRFIQFAVSPASGYSLTVTSVSMSLGAAGGGNMRANIWYSTDPSFAARTQLNSSVLALPNGSFVSPAPNYSVNVLVNDGQTFHVRIYPWYTTSASGKYVCPQNVVISGTTAGALASITTSVSSLGLFQHTVGLPSSEQLYTLSGTGLIGDVVVTPPVGFEISADGGSTWNNNSSPLILTQSGGVIPGQPVSLAVRMNGPSAGEYSGNVTHSSPGATAQNVAVIGVTLAPEPTVQSSVSFGSVTGTSIVVNFSVGNGTGRIVAVRAGSAVSWTPTDGNVVGGVDGNFSVATDHGGGNKAVYDGTGSNVTVTGLLSNTTYHFFVFEYNVGSGNSQNYNTASPGTGSQTTLAVPTIIVTPASLSFGSVEINTTSIEKIYSLSGSLLTPASGNITATAPTGFEASTTSGSGFVSSVDVPYSGGELSATTIYVRFTPTAVQGYNGNVTNAGGGATGQNVSVAGSGVVPAEQNVFQAEGGILTSAYVGTQYSGYTGLGYVDLADKIGSALEIVFRRSTAATDTVEVFYANGGSSRAYSVSVNDVTIGSLSFASTGGWATWSSVIMMVSLQSGVNRLKFSSTTNGGNANLDRIYIGGQTATPLYKLTLTQSGAGTVSASPSDAYYDAGTQVTLTATPSGGNVFYRWAGTDESTSNPYIMTVNSHKTEIGLMMDPPNGSFLYETAPTGFAAVGALGYPSGTTGGSGPGSHTVYITNSDDLANIMLRRVDANHTLNFPPLTVYVIGTLTTGSVVTDMVDVKDVYDISIIGVGVDATLSGFGVSIVRSSNIIVRNLKIQNSPIDGVTIQADDSETTGHHIWIDHCTITNCFDGALDVTHTASYVTISWNYFYNHEKTCLMGHSDSQASDVAMKVTYHHNYFDSTGQRHPRVRYGKAHVYNNYYRKNQLYGVSSNLEADVVVEGCYFLNVPIPVETSRDGSPPGDLVERNNIFVNCGVPGTRGTAFDPSLFYSFTADDPSTIPQMLTSYAGSGKFDFIGSEPPLPIQLASFTGTMVDEHTVQLDWTTLSEINNYGFIVQREASTGRAFTELPNGFVPGHGTTNVPQHYQYTDMTAGRGSWYYRLKQIDLDNTTHYTDPIRIDVLTDVKELAPTEFSLSQNYPNPFNPQTSIKFSVERTGRAILEVYDLLGRRVATLFDDVAEAGQYYSLVFDARAFGSGVYFYRLQSSGKSDLKKLLLLK